MAAEKGSAFLLKIGDGESPVGYTTIAGLRTTQMSINGDPVVITNKDSGGWRQLLSGAGVRSVSVSGAGVFTGSDAETIALSDTLDIDSAEIEGILSDDAIPSLTFEVIAEDGSVSLVDIVGEISAGQIRLESDEQLHGYSAGGTDRREAISAITSNFLLSYTPQENFISARSRSDNSANLDDGVAHQIVANIDGARSDNLEIQSLPETKTPRQLALRYYDPARDYQSSLQNAFRPGVGRAIMNLEFPASIDASQAKHIGQMHLWTIYRERESARVEFTQSSNDIRPGHIVSVPDAQGKWLVRNVEIKDGAITASLSKASHIRIPYREAGEEGRIVSYLDALAGETRLVLADLPFAPEAVDQATDEAQLFAAAAGDSGWRNAELFTVADDGSINEPIATIASPSVLGIVDNELAPSSATIVDRRNHLDVSLHNSQMTLHHADEEQMLNGANIALIGQEILQFGEAWPLGNNRFRLTRLIRGIGGTEGEIGFHSAGENFLQLNLENLTAINSHHYAIFHAATFGAVGRGDESPTFASIQQPGLALKPWSPVHSSIRFDPSGDLHLHWVRRSRSGSQWLDHVEIPVAEEKEKYLINWTNDQHDIDQSAEVISPEHIVSAAKLDSYRSLGAGQLQFSIKQVGNLALSDPLTFLVDI